MKLKYILALFMGLIVTSQTMKATDGKVTVTPGSPNPNPVCLGSAVTVSASGASVAPTDANCEITITNQIWSWTAKDADGNTVATQAGGTSWAFDWTPTSCGSQTLTITASVEFQGTTCNGTYDQSFSGSAPVTVTVIQITADSVDASDPANTVVNYTLKPLGLSGTAHFVAPGADVTKNISSGFFQFTYNQHNLTKGSQNLINLTANVNCSNGQTVSCDANIGASVNSAHNTHDNLAFGRILMDIDGRPAAILVPISHYLTELYYCVAYTIPYSGMTTWTSKSHSVINISESGEIPSEIKSWTENHSFNSDPTQQMVVDTGPALWPGGLGNWMAADLSTDIFYDPGVQGNADLSALVFYDPAGPVFLMPSFLPPSNRTVSVGLTCP